MNGRALLLTLVVASAVPALSQQKNTAFNEVMAEVATAQNQQLEQSKRDSEKFSKEWAPPGQQLASVSGDTRFFILQARSDKSLPEVWAHYAGKLGIEAAYKPNDRGENSTSLPRTVYLNSNSKGAGAKGGASRAMATLALQDHSTRSVIVSLVKDGASTLVSVNLTGGDSTAASNSSKPKSKRAAFFGGPPGGD